MAKNKFYVVWRGRRCGIFDNWDDCKAQIDKFEGAVYKGFATYSQAEEAFDGGVPNFRRTKETNEKSRNTADYPSTIRGIAVDAACSGNPGQMEYRGVWIGSGKEIFHSKVYPEATNNIGEFLALVHILALSKQEGWHYDIYSDSRNAILWVQQGRCKTKLTPNSRNAEIFELIRRAETWLANNSPTNRIIKWETDLWGEIPADFGRK